MRRRATVLVTAAVIGLALIAASSAVAGPATAEPRADTASQYEVFDARTLGQRNVIAGHRRRHRRRRARRRVDHRDRR